MNILDTIISDKKEEVAHNKAVIPVKELEKRPLFRADRPSFRAALATAGPSIIAEFKRKSPSRGFINPEARPEDVIPGYRHAGASAISVLTDRHFGGSLDDLVAASGCAGLPLLRKDFIIDEYQVFEARSAGASALLLIAAALEKGDLISLSNRAADLGLDVLFEVHSEAELEKCPQNITIIGVNNRDLETFRVDTEVSVALSRLIPPSYLRVSESGISDPPTITKLSKAGFDAFLVGEAFMGSTDPAQKAQQFIKQVNILKPV